MSDRTFRISAVLCGLLPAAARLPAAKRDATSIDFLWLASRNYWARISPYSMASPGCYGGDGFPATSAECTAYLHTYPMLLGLFSGFTFETAATLFFWTNLATIPITLYALSRAFGLGWTQTVVLSAVFGISLGTYNTLVNGQAGLLTLLLLIAIPLLLRSSRQDLLVGLLAGLGAFKLSLSAPFVALYLVTRPRLGFGAALSSAIAGAFSAAWLVAPWTETLLGPLRVSSALGAWTRTHSSGDLPRVLNDLNVADSLILTGGLALIGLALVIGLWRKSMDFLASLAGAAVVSLMFFPHFPYDYLLLVVTFSFSLSRWSQNLGRILALLSGVLLVSPQYLLRAMGSLLGMESIRAAAVEFAWPMSMAASRATLVALAFAFWLVWVLSGSMRSSAALRLESSN